jgi:hypothetical protein
MDTYIEIDLSIGCSEKDTRGGRRRAAGGTHGSDGRPSAAPQRNHAAGQPPKIKVSG